MKTWCVRMLSIPALLQSETTLSEKGLPPSFSFDSPSYHPPRPSRCTLATQKPLPCAASLSLFLLSDKGTPCVPWPWSCRQCAWWNDRMWPVLTTRCPHLEMRLSTAAFRYQFPNESHLHQIRTSVIHTPSGLLMSEYF